MDQDKFTPQLAPAPQLFEVQQEGRKIPFVVVPDGWTGRFLTEHIHTPALVSGKQGTADTKSFKAYFDRFRDERTLVKAYRSGNSVVAELDHHLNAATPSPGKHSLIRKFIADRRFTAWKTSNKKSFNQVQFAEFLEDRILDVTTPKQGELLRSIVQFKAFRQSNCASVIEANGDVRFEFTQVTQSPAGSAVLPDRIEITIPVLEYETEWTISARLRYELNEQKVKFNYELIAIEDVEDLAFRHAVEGLSKEIGAGILLAD